MSAVGGSAGQGAPTCPICDAPVGVTDRFCARCGHDLGAGFVPLVGREVTVSEGTTGGRPRPGRTRAATIAVAAVAIAVVVSLGVAWLVGGDDGTDEAEPAGDLEPDDRPASAFDPRGDLAEVAGDDRSPAAARDRRTEIRPGPTPAAPMLDVESGLTVVVRTPTTLLVIDLDTGDQTLIEAVAPDADTISGSATALVGDELWALDDTGLRAFLFDELREVDAARDGFDADQIVGLYGGRSSSEAVVTVSADGDHVLHPPGGAPVPFILPPGFRVIGVGGDEVVLTRPEIGGVWLLGAGRVSTGRPLAVSNGRVLVLDCADDLACFFEVLDLSNGETLHAVPAGAEPPLPDDVSTSVLSPDGSLYVLAGGGSTTEQVLDLTTGERIPGLVTGIVTAGAFSPDSTWLFVGGDAADRALLTAVPPDFRVPQRAIATNVDLGAATEVLVVGSVGT